jgi:predicted homoserine dehydrogenase-like protein
VIIVDTALAAREAEGRPILVGLVGAGIMGRGIARQILLNALGQRLVAVANHRLDGARQAYLEAGQPEPRYVQRLDHLEDAIRAQQPAVTDDACLLAQAEGIDVLIEVTGTIEPAARVVLSAIEHRKPVILMNVQLDATLGPILQVYARRKGVILSAPDGDQPGAQLNLYRYARGVGLEPLVCGNVKGLQDHYRTPTTQAEFARKWQQKPRMVTGFADGTEISFEQATVANATGMTIARRGMLGFEHAGHVEQLADRYDLDMLRASGGIVDYVVGARPNAAVYVIAAEDDPRQRFYLELYKLGKGPLYCLYTPHHLCHMEVPLSVGRVALFEDVVAAPQGRPSVDVIATAKRDLAAGEVVDGIGGYLTYGQCERSDVVRAQRLLPMGLADGAVLRRSVPRDAVLSYDDVTLAGDRLADRLRAEQDAYFS